MLTLAYIPEKAADPLVGPQIHRAQKLVDRYQSQIEGDLVISVGGDGSHLYASHNYPDTRLLLVRPVGTKSTNYLPDKTVEDLEACLARVAAGDYLLQELHRLEVKLNGEPVGTVLQDAWLERDSNTIECAVTVHDRATGQTLWKDRAKLDVLVVYNALGASAYSHSVGSPLMEWDTPIIGIAQVAPSRALIGKHGYLFPTHLGQREARVELVGWKKESGKLVLDWGRREKVHHDDTLTFAKSAQTTPLVRVDPEPLYQKQLRKQEIDFISFRAADGTLGQLEGLMQEYH